MFRRVEQREHSGENSEKYSHEEKQQQWSLFDESLETVASILRKQNLLESIAEFFVLNGDVCSVLYTNSPAMHSALMRDYSPNISSAPLNAIIAIQRRYQNLYLDQARQSQYEMLLGMNLDKHLPSLLGNSVECLSRYPSFSLKNVPCVLSNVKTPELLLQDADNFCWICPSGYDIVELYIYLHQPAYVTELSLTICHGSSDETSPRIIDMFMGSYLDKMNVVFQGLTIPRAASGSQLYYSIPSSIWKAYEGSGIYDFEIGSDQSKEVTQTRIVHIVFRGTPTDYNMSLGKLELFGVISRAEYPLRALHRLQDQLTLLTVEKVLKEVNAPTQTSSSTNNSTNNTDNTNTSTSNSSNSATSSSSSATAVSDNNNTQPKYITTSSPKATASDSLEEQQQKIEEFVQKIREKMETVDQLTFLDTLELELFRLQHKISPQERDSILLELKLDIEKFNPDRYIYPRDEKTEISLRKSSKYKSSKCASSECKESLGILRQRQCCYCYRRFCSNCMSPAPAKILEFMWEKPQMVCKACYSILTQQDELLKKIKRLGEQQRLNQFQSSHNQIAEMLLAVQHCQYSGDSMPPKAGDAIVLSHYPNAGILISVPTAPGSCVESILFPPHLVPLDVFWSAPVDCSTVQITIVLSQEADIHRLCLLVDSLGYTAADAPTIKIMIGSMTNSLKEAGVWNIAEQTMPIGAKQCLEYRLSQPMKGRLVSIQLSLPDVQTKYSEALNENTAQPFLHLGRLQIFGVHSLPTILTHMNPLSSATPAERIYYEKAFNTIPPKAQNQIRPLWAQYRSGRKILDMCIEPVLISGFSVLARHGEEGVSTQVKMIRVVGITTDAKGEMTALRQICKIVVPKVKANTELFFDFAQPTIANIVTFEFVSNYGGTEQVPPKVALF